MGNFHAKNMSSFSTQKRSPVKNSEQRSKRPAHCLHNFSWGTIVTETFYQIPGKQDITEITFLNPHLLIGIAMGYDSGL